jgi:MFS family permease
MEQLQSIIEPNATPAAAAGDTSATAARDFGPYASFSLGFLTLISAFNYLDRSILGLALPAIKKEMEVSDTMLGLVSGLAFVIFYSLLGVPIAWLADRVSRRNIIAIGFAFWSLMTALTGFAANIWQLAVARFLMGAGEACGLAPSNALISDLFRRERRPLALSLFGMANSLSLIVFFPLMGIVGQRYGWRAMFTAAGLPGVLLALVFFLTVKEPARGALEQHTNADSPSLRATLTFLFGSRAYVWMLLGSTFMGANAFASGAWTPTFLTRVHGMTLAEVASTVGPTRGVLGALGILAGGVLADRLGKRDERYRVRVPAFACLALAPAELLFLLGPSRTLWMTGFALTSFLTLLHMGPIFAATLNVSGVRMRAVASSLMVLCASLLGQALGPLIVGYLNDRLEPQFGAEAVRYSLLITVGTALGAGLCFLRTARHIVRDSQRAVGN